MSWIEIIADRKIRDAQEEGAFDNLPGKGKPLNLDFDPRVPPELRATYRLMKEAQILPDWIQLDKEIRVREERWGELLENYRRTRQAELARAAACPTREQREAERRVDIARDRFLRSTFDTLRELNRMIDRLNLIVPAISRQRLRLDLRARLRELEVEFPRLAPAPGGPAEPWEREDAQPTGAVSLNNRMPLRRRKDTLG